MPSLPRTALGVSRRNQIQSLSESPGGRQAPKKREMYFWMCDALRVPLQTHGRSSMQTDHSQIFVAVSLGAEASICKDHRGCW